MCFTETHNINKGRAIYIRANRSYGLEGTKPPTKLWRSRSKRNPVLWVSFGTRHCVWTSRTSKFIVILFSGGPYQCQIVHCGMFFGKMDKSKHWDQIVFIVQKTQYASESTLTLSMFSILAVVCHTQSKMYFLLALVRGVLSCASLWRNELAPPTTKWPPRQWIPTYSDVCFKRSLLQFTKKI